MKYRRVILVRAQRLLIGLSVLWLTSATPTLAATNSTWQQATKLRPPLAGQIKYGTLGREGSSAFFRFSSGGPGSIKIRLSVPTWADDRFTPQIVIYQPETMTIGPVLAMPQPPETLASIYPSAAADTAFDPSTLIAHRLVLSTTVALPQSGQYYLAVYNAGTATGRWRLEFAGQAKFTGILRWPVQWWQDNAWAGWTWQTVFTPLWLVAMFAALLTVLHRKSGLASTKKTIQSTKRKNPVRSDKDKVKK